MYSFKNDHYENKYFFKSGGILSIDNYSRFTYIVIYLRKYYNYNKQALFNLLNYKL